jgi:hypothetical protein
LRVTPFTPANTLFDGYLEIRKKTARRAAPTWYATMHVYCLTVAASNAPAVQPQTLMLRHHKKLHNTAR